MLLQPCPVAEDASRVTSRTRILYVDADVYVRRLSAVALARSGYDLDTVADDEEAWSALHDVSYQLLITEHDLPRIDGLKLVLRARRMGMLIPAVIASDAASLLHPEVVTCLGLAAYLGKPFSLDQLLDVVDRVLATARNFCASDGKPTPISKLRNGTQHINFFSRGGLNE
jgi:DNA-binding response OmpR family regulator